MNPFFSVIIPAYNREYLIEETINSVINQTFENWECIVVDDGSTDNTKHVILSLCEKDKRIKFIYQKNAERSAARNNGILNANGEYICFLDSDDFFTSQHLEMLHREVFLRDNPIALFFTGFKIQENGNLKDPEINKLNGSKDIDYFFNNAIIPARICGHHSIFDNEKFDEDIVIVEDMLLWVRIAEKYPVHQLFQNSVIYSIHENNSIHLNSNAGLRKLKGLKIFFQRYKDIMKKAHHSTKNKLLTDCYFRIAQSHIYQGRKRIAIRFTLLSILYNVDKEQLKHKWYVLLSLLINKKIKEYKKE
jgi:glycosyltransferase involved in cell wall biosynthesis